MRLATVLLFLAALLTAAPDAVAQNYGALFGADASEEDGAETTETDAETVDVAAEGEGENEAAPDYSGIAAGVEAGDEGPGLDAYGAVAETFERTSAIEMTQQRLGIFRQKLRRLIAAVPEYPALVDELLASQSPTGHSSYFIGVLIFVALLLAIGRAVTLIFALFVALRVMRAVQDKEAPEGIVDKLPVLTVRVFLQIAGLIITIIVAGLIASGFYEDNEATLKTAIAITIGYALVQVVDVCWRMVVSPFLPLYRIPAITDRDARRLYRWMAIVTIVTVSTLVFSTWLEEMGAGEEIIAITIMTATFLSILLIFAMMRACGKAIDFAILGGLEPHYATRGAVLATYVWRPVLIIYLLGAFGELSFRLVMGLERGLPLLAGLFAVILAALIVYAVTVWVVQKIFQRSRQMRKLNEAADAAEAEELAEEGRDEADKAAIRDALSEIDDEGGGAGAAAMAYRPPPSRSGMNTFEDLAERVASLFAVGAAAYALIYIWAGPEAFAEGTLLDMAQDLIDVAFIGYVTFHAVRIWMDRKIEEEGGPAQESEPGDEGGAGAAASRLATLLPLFRTTVLLVIAVTSVFLVLVELGVNVGPLFAGAGVVGLAIGFGAQSLVRDILSGVFFLSDDAFRKGEYIDIGDVKGTVEKISLRSFQLRHHLGALNTIPFGEIKFLTNYSRDWVMMKLPLRLTYDTDVDKVRKLVKKLGVKLLDHPTEGHKFVQPLKSQGVYMMEDSAMIIRVKFMTKPGDQWTTRKLVYQEIRNLFEKEGIKFAHKEVLVRIPEIESRNVDDLSEDEKKAIGAAARRAVEEQEPQKAPADDR